jgi:peptide/nickel transport system substrate-binding protein
MSNQTLPLRDMRVRKALNYAVNKKELMRYAFKGNATRMKGVLMEKSNVDLSDTETYEWNVPKARRLLNEAGYGEGFRMKIACQKKDYLTAQFLQRFYSLLDIEVEIISADWEWFVRHVVYPNTREGYSWDDEDWWMLIGSNPSYVPEVMYGQFEWHFHLGAPWQSSPAWLMVPLDRMYHELLRTNDREKRFHIYKKANNYIADQALWVFTMAPLGLYAVNKEVEFAPQVSQYLYLDYSSVTDRHWSVRGQNH